VSHGKRDPIIPQKEAANTCNQILMKGTGEGVNGIEDKVRNNPDLGTPKHPLIS
jgi:hypothetical protein